MTQNRKTTRPRSQAPVVIVGDPDRFEDPEKVPTREVKDNGTGRRYLNPAVLQEETLKTLAGIELQQHRYWLIYVAGGKNPEQLAENGQPILQEIARLDQAIVRIETEFADILNPRNGA